MTKATKERQHKDKLLNGMFDELSDRRRELRQARNALHDAEEAVDDVLDRIRQLVLTD